ncbi:EamA family transporter [Paenibacillus gansuensis]|uniref:DMT family transporter n=1 Tax=Paenibacillus gansuensis TaxID=306542 RepID=A0ABW5PII0_9BACL
MRYSIYVFLGACSFGVLSTFVKLAYADGYTVNQVSGSQMLFGLLLFAVVYPFTGKSRMTLRQTAFLLLVGITVGLTGIFYYSALQTIPASIAIVLLFQFTWMGVLMEAFLARRKPDRSQWISLVLLFGGTILAGGILGTQGALEGITWTGVVLGLLSALSYAFFIVLSGKAPAELPFIQRSLVISVGSLIITFLIFPPDFLADGSLFGRLSLWGFLLGFFGPVIPTLLFTIGVPRIGGSLASILSAAELPVAVLMSWLVLSETVSGWQWVGVAVILTGIVLPEWLTRRSKEAGPA